MARRTKQLVRNRAKAHSRHIKAGQKRKTRAKSRGFHPASARRRKRALRRGKKK